MEELLSFAHEMGHHRSWLARTFCDFDEDKPRETYAEEYRAWMHGRRFLDAYGSTQWGAFDQREEASLLGYEEGPKLAAEATAEIRQAITEEIGKLSARWYLDPWPPTQDS